MFRRLLLLVSCVGMMPSLAEAAPKPSTHTDQILETCVNKADAVDIDMRDCWADFAAREDKRLNNNWKRLMKAVDGPKTEIGNALVAEEKAWINFKNIACQDYSVGTGTLDRLMDAMCFADLISERADQLEFRAHYYDTN